MALVSDGTVTAFLYTTDVDRCLAWYQGVIGLPAHGRDDYGAFLSSGSALVRVTVLPDFKAGEHPVLGWDVPDIRAAAQELREKGVTFTVYDDMGQDELGIWNSPDGETRLAWFTDPDGNVLSLSETPNR
ncbi:VOC family protein [Sphingomonas arenae]|uniref:VOC family protein n=1 Tax=Sphingomonas arenae TaxID=2812555 RepID=UPI001966D5C1|nr:VOC family protein [Sphingomonas arenae]